MNKSDPFKTMYATVILLVMAGATASVATLYRRADPVLGELQQITADCADPSADARRLRGRLDMLVDTHGMDYIIANRTREEAFIRADRGVQRCEMLQPDADRARTGNPQ